MIFKKETRKKKGKKKKTRLKFPLDARKKEKNVIIFSHFFYSFRGMKVTLKRIGLIFLTCYFLITCYTGYQFIRKYLNSELGNRQKILDKLIEVDEGQLKITFFFRFFLIDFLYSALINFKQNQKLKIKKKFNSIFLNFLFLFHKNGTFRI